IKCANSSPRVRQLAQGSSRSTHSNVASSESKGMTSFNAAILSHRSVVSNFATKRGCSDNCRSVVAAARPASLNFESADLAPERFRIDATKLNSSFAKLSLSQVASSGQLTIARAHEMFSARRADAKSSVPNDAGNILYKLGNVMSCITVTLK